MCKTVVRTSQINIINIKQHIAENTIAKHGIDFINTNKTIARQARSIGNNTQPLLPLQVNQTTKLLHKNTFISPITRSC